MKVRHEKCNPGEARIKLKSIAFWRSVIADEQNQPSRRVTYCRNKLASYRPEDIAHLEQRASENWIISKRQTGLTLSKKKQHDTKY